MFAIMCPQIIEEDMLELAKLGTDLDLDENLLDKVVSYICN